MADNLPAAAAAPPPPGPTPPVAAASTAHPLRNVPWTAGEAVKVFLVAWIGAPVAFILILMALPGVAWARDFLAAFRAGDITASFIFALVDSAAAAAIVAYYTLKRRASLASLGIRPFNVGRTIFYIVAVLFGFIVLMMITYGLITWLFPQFNPDQQQVNEFTRAAADPSTRQLSFIALVLLPPIIEEVVFRGFMFPALSRRFGLIFGAVTSSLLFGIAHLQLNVGVYTVVLGLLLCFLYVRLRSIVPGILVHMLNNYLAFVALTTR